MNIYLFSVNFAFDLIAVCGRARSIIQAGVDPAPARLVNHRIANIGQAEVTPNVKHDGRKPLGRKCKLK